MLAPIGRVKRRGRLKDAIGAEKVRITGTAGAFRDGLADGMTALALALGA